jgi:membrane protease YdiL (CAAX protease family)
MAIKYVAHHDESVSNMAGTVAGRDGGTVVAWVHRHPVAAYLAWYFAAVWAITLIPTVAARTVLHQELPGWALQLCINASTFLGIFLPAVIITRLVDGRAGVRALLGRTFKVRVARRWYAVALLAHAVPTVLVAVALYGRPATTASALLAAVGSGFLLQLLIGLFLNNLWEEVGVMGFLQARLQARRGALLGAVLTAPLFALQHLALFVGDGLATGLVILAAATALMVPFRAMLGWLYNRSGSLFLVGLLHAAGNAVAAGTYFGDSFLKHLYDAPAIGGLHSLVAVPLGLALIAATRGRLGRHARGAAAQSGDVRPAQAE